MNTTTNEVAGTENSEQTKTRKARLPIQKRFVQNDGNAVTVANNDISQLSFQFGEGGESVVVQIADYAKHSAALIAYGLRALLNGSLVNVDTLQEAKEALLEKAKAIAEGNFSDRGSERGINLSQFATVLAAAAGMTVEAARNFIAGKAALLEGKEVKEIVVKSKDGDYTEEQDAFDRWVLAIRSTNDYKQKASELFPRERKSSTPKSLSDLLG